MRGVPGYTLRMVPSVRAGLRAQARRLALLVAAGCVAGIAASYLRAPALALHRGALVRDLRASDPLGAIRAWLGRDLARSPVANLPGGHLGTRRFGILYMADCNSCKVGVADLGPASVRKDIPVVFVTTSQAVAGYYKVPFVVDPSRRTMPAEWYLAGNHFFVIDAQGRLESVTDGKEEVVAMVRGGGQ